MEEDGSGSGQGSWKEKLESLSKRGKALTNDLGSKLSDAGKKASVASVEAASKAKETLEDLMDEIGTLAEEIPEPSPQSQAPAEKDAPSPKENIGFFATIKQTPTLIGFAVIWAVLLVIVVSYVEGEGLEIYGYSADSFVWIAGTMIWSYVVLTQISNAGSFAVLPLSFRVQATMGVGVATAAISLLPELEELSAMFHIFSWLVIVALTILVASSFMNGIRTFMGN